MMSVVGKATRPEPPFLVKVEAGIMVVPIAESAAFRYEGSEALMAQASPSVRKKRT